MIRRCMRRKDYIVIAAVSITAIMLIFMFFIIFCIQSQGENEQRVITDTAHYSIEGSSRRKSDLFKALLLFLAVSIIFISGLIILVLRYIIISKQLRRVQDEKKQALASLYHNINSSLTPIIGFAEFMLKRDVSKEKQMLYLNAIYDKALNIRDIINNEEKKGV